MHSQSMTSHPSFSSWLIDGVLHVNGEVLSGLIQVPLIVLRRLLAERVPCSQVSSC